MADTHPWEAHYPKHLSWDMALDTTPLPEILRDNAVRYADNPALYFLGRTLTYGELWEHVEQLSASLQQLGVRKGMRVGLLLPNCPAFVVSYYAILRCGGVVVNFNPLYSEAELQHQLADCGAEILITTTLTLCLEKVMRVRDKTACKKVVVVDFARQLPALKGTLFSLLKRKDCCTPPADDAAYVRYEALPHHTENWQPVDVRGSDVAVLQYTGGTTGVPKGAVLTHANIAANAQQSALWCQPQLPDGEGRMMGVLPLFHVFAMTVVMNMALRKGMEIILLPRFELKQLLKTIHRMKPAALPGVPTMYAAIANAQDVSRYRLTSIRCCISGGAPLPQEIKDRFEALSQSVLVEGYGLTEAAPVCACNPLDEKAEDSKAGTIGLPFPGTEISLRDPKKPKKKVKMGEKGELCIRGPQVMQGYWNRAEESKDVFVEGEFPPLLRTGDIGIMHADGRVEIVDRIKEMIISNGYNIYPRHVEEAIYQHKAVAECAVIGLPDAKMGQKVVACIVCREDTCLEESELKTFLSDKLSRYALPKQVIIRESLPKSMIGKILKKELLRELRH